MKKALFITMVVASAALINPINAQERPPRGEQPERPENPRNPDQPRNPDEPRNPEQPRNPDNPRRNPDNPRNPDEPRRNPGNPENPGNPGEPDNPDNPGEPENPGNPGEPDNPGEPEEPGEPENPGNNALDQELQQLVQQMNLDPIEDTGLPSIEDPLPQLGKDLFFAKNLGGEQSAACVTCHHPMLGGTDNISLSVGVDAVNELDQDSHDLLGHGRFNGNDDDNLLSVPRNAPSVFNAGLNEQRMFWDGRVERVRNGGILTPDSNTNPQGNRVPDANLPAGTTIAAAQARFPVTSPDEMRGDFEFDLDNQELRAALEQRFTNESDDFQSTWPQAFEVAYGDTEVSFDRIFEAIGEYERSMTFVDSPWNNYLAGDTTALTDQEKAGAILFFTPRNQGGAGCSRCHSGSMLAGNGHQLVAFPQFGPGKGNPGENANDHDFGRENITGDQEDRFHFRAPSLLNIEVTAPYGHAGAYETLEEVVRHYNNPRQAINRLFGAQGGQAFANGNAPFCQLPQIAALMQKNNLSCDEIYPDAYDNSIAVADYLDDARDGDVPARDILNGGAGLNGNERAQVVAFLRALTDPCVLDRECMDPWIVDGGDVASFPDDKPLVATNEDSQEL